MMESQCEYSVRTKNRFVLDDIEGDPFELIKETQSKPKKEKAKKLAAPKKEDAPVINNNVEDAVPTENSQRGGQRGGAARGVRGGRGRGGGQGRGERVITETCYKCQEVGHFARDCVNAPPPPPMECHNCKGPHMVRDCPEPREPRRAPQPVRICHRCQEEGHFVRDCPQPNPVQQQKGPCHNCQEFGHFVRECPNESSADNTESVGFGDGDLDGGMGGFGSPGDANEVSNDFGGFGGFGTPSGGFGEPDERGSEGRGRGRGRGGRGGRGRGGGGRGRLDRHSGNDKSGVKATEKKDGHGANNWGKSTDQESYVDDAKFDSPVETDQEDDSNTMTYENWKAQQAGLDTKPQFDIRKVECDGKQVEVKKKDPVESNALFTGQEFYEYRVKDSGRKHVRCDQKIIAFEFDGGSNRQLGSERGGRGRGGQRAGRSEKRANDNKENVAFFVNSEDFPTL